MSGIFNNILIHINISIHTLPPCLVCELCEFEPYEFNGLLLVDDGAVLSPWPGPADRAVGRLAAPAFAPPPFNVVRTVRIEPAVFMGGRAAPSPAARRHGSSLEGEGPGRYACATHGGSGTRHDATAGKGGDIA